MILGVIFLALFGVLCAFLSVYGIYRSFKCGDGADFVFGVVFGLMSFGLFMSSFSIYEVSERSKKCETVDLGYHYIISDTPNIILEKDVMEEEGVWLIKMQRFQGNEYCTSRRILSKASLVKKLDLDMNELKPIEEKENE